MSLKGCKILFHQNPLGLPIKGIQPIPGRMAANLPVKKRILSIAHIIMISSAKGGVGKSTTAVNLAISFAALGKRTGLLDADIHGPSIPLMMRLSKNNQQSKNDLDFTPLLSKSDKLLPLMEYGVKCMSMGFLVSDKDPVVWRGMMLSKAIQQLLWSVEWGDLDVLIIDSPPGTGDIHLSICQQMVIDGAIVISTPQDVALADTIKGIEMFSKLKVPVLGLVQNMSYFKCPNCSTTTHIFGTDGVARKAESLSIDLLASIPLNAELCELADRGKPITIVQPNGIHAQEYKQMAQKAWKNITGKAI